MDTLASPLSTLSLGAFLKCRRAKDLMVDELGGFAQACGRGGPVSSPRPQDSRDRRDSTLALSSNINLSSVPSPQLRESMPSAPLCLRT